MPHEPGGSESAALANAMVGLKKQYSGAGRLRRRPSSSTTYVFVAMEGGLTRNEETLLADGKEELVRSYRLSFQETMAATTMSAVQEIAGRKVLTYHSQIAFHPTRGFEIFLLEPEPPDKST
jgi:uncharacterized protein YbcI